MTIRRGDIYERNGRRRRIEFISEHPSFRGGIGVVYRLLQRNGKWGTPRDCNMAAWRRWMEWATRVNQDKGETT